MHSLHRHSNSSFIHRLHTLLVCGQNICRGGRGEGDKSEVGFADNWDSVEVKIGEQLSEDDDDNKEHGEPEQGEAPAKDWEAGGFPVGSVLPWFGLDQRAREVRIDLKEAGLTL